MGDLHHRSYGAGGRPGGPSVTLSPVRLKVAGPIFREVATDAPWRWKGLTAFKLPQRLLAGEDVSEYIAWARSVGANTLRVFLQHRFLDWPEVRPYITPIENVRPFVDWCAEQGFYVELTVLCDTQEDGFNQTLDWQATRVQDVIRAVADAPNVFVEIKNEPSQNGYLVHEIIERLALQDPRNRPVLMASGEYPVTGQEPINTTAGDSVWVLDYIGDHPERKVEWPDEAGKTGEYVREQCKKYGITNVAHVYDEPIRCGEDARDGQETSPQQYEDAGGGIGIRSAGGTFHSNNGVQSVSPGPVQDACARAYFGAMDRFPGDAPLGRYAHDGTSGHPLQVTSLAGEVADSIMPDGVTYTVASRVQPGWEARPLPGRQLRYLNDRETQMETR